MNEAISNFVCTGFQIQLMELNQMLTKAFNQKMLGIGVFTWGKTYLCKNLTGHLLKGNIFSGTYGFIKLCSAYKTFMQCYQKYHRCLYNIISDFIALLSMLAWHKQCIHTFPLYLLCIHRDISASFYAHILWAVKFSNFPERCYKVSFNHTEFIINLVRACHQTKPTL